MLGCVVVDAQAAIIKVGSQPFEAGEAIADRAGRGRFLGGLRFLVWPFTSEKVLGWLRSKRCLLAALHLKWRRTDNVRLTLN